MLAPLDERMLCSLVTYDEEFEYTTHSDPESPLERIVSVEACGLFSIVFNSFGSSSTPLVQGVAQSGLMHRIALLSSGYAELVTAGSRVADEYVERPWKHLSIRSDPVDKISCRVFEDETYTKTYKMLGCLDQWVDLVRWLCNYGNERAIALAAMDARRRGYLDSPIAQETLLTYAYQARKNCANPTFSLPSRRSKSRSSKSRNKQKPPPPPPPLSLAHPASHVLRRTGLRPHQGIKSRGKQRTSLLSTMTLASVEEDTHVEEQVLEEAVPNDCHVQESGANRQRTPEMLFKQSTIENIERELADTQVLCVDEVG